MSKVRVECNCKICQTNAAKLGKAVPLAAMVPAPLLAASKGKGQAHGLVYSANDPTVVGVAVRKSTGLEAA